MSEPLATGSRQTQVDRSVFTILDGTTIPDRAAIVRTECREGSRVELRRHGAAGADSERIGVWLECEPLLGLLKVWKKIGYVPDETAALILPFSDRSASVVAYGVVRGVYAPTGRDEAVVTVEIKPQLRA